MARNPVSDGFSMPAEWAKHECCYISWPCREESWSGFIKETRKAYAEVIRAIALFEPVCVISDPSTMPEVKSAVGSIAELIEMPLDDAWIRDNGPIFVRSEKGEVAAVKFGFNGWGGRFPPYDKDANVPSLLTRRLKMKCYEVPMILEGGSIHVDGEGTLLATESCLLNPNRNPKMSRKDIEKALQTNLGIKKTLWLKNGLYKSMVDGHIDGIASFTRPGTILLAQSDDPGNPNYQSMRENKEDLSTFTDARGKSIEVIDFPMPSRVELGGNRLASCYANFYIANGGIVAPIFGEPKDKAALEILESAFPGREVVGVRSEHIAIGGGDVHCITQQRPSGPIFPP